MRRERVTGSLREDLEMAHLDWLTEPFLLRYYRSWGPHHKLSLDEKYPQARRWNVWPEALKAYIEYQNPEKWREAFVKGIS